MIQKRPAVTSHVGKRGTIVIPAALRRELGLEEGTTIMISSDKDGAVIIRAVPEDPVERLRWAFRGVFTGVDPEDYLRELRADWDE